MKHIVSVKRRLTPLLLLLLCIPMLLNNASCTMFLVKEGYKEVKKLEEEHKEKKEQQERQERRWETQPLPDSSDAAAPAEPQPPRHHGQWTPQREE